MGSDHENEKSRSRHRHKDKKERKRRHEDSEQLNEPEPTTSTEIATTEVEAIPAEVPATASTTTTEPLPTVSNAPSAPEKVPDSGENGKPKEDEDESRLVPWMAFECMQCRFTATTFFKELNISDGFYPFPVFYMRDPFTPPPRVRGRKPVLADYVVLGSTCHMCELPMCFAKTCGLYFGAHFCATCVMRERRKFPDKLVEGLVKAHRGLEKEAEKKKAEKEESKKEKK